MSPVVRHPLAEAGPQVSVHVLDNEHMTLHILSGSGVTLTLDEQEPTRYVVAIPRVQLVDQADPADVAEALATPRAVQVESGSAKPKPMVNWWRTFRQAATCFKPRGVEAAKPRSRPRRWAAPSSDAMQT
jgi:hypothetical protein